MDTIIGLGLYPSCWNKGVLFVCLCSGGMDGVGGTWTRVWKGGVMLCQCELRVRIVCIDGRFRYLYFVIGGYLHTGFHHVAPYRYMFLLHCIQKIRNCLSLDICKLLVHTLVTVCLDYGNVLLCGARDGIIRHLECVQRQAARVVCRKIKYDRHTSVTELLWGFHWMPILARIQYKVLLLVYKAFNSSNPPISPIC